MFLTTGSSAAEWRAVRAPAAAG